MLLKFKGSYVVTSCCFYFCLPRQDDTFSLEQEIAGVGGVGNYPGTTLTPSAANAHAHTSASSAGPSRVPSPVRLSLPVSTLVEKVFTEKPGGGFRSGTCE